MRSIRKLITGLNHVDRADWYTRRLQPAALARRKLLRRIQVHRQVRHNAAQRPATDMSSCVNAPHPAIEANACLISWRQLLFGAVGVACGRTA
jgi:hypothetical protein